MERGGGGSGGCQVSGKFQRWFYEEVEISTSELYCLQMVALGKKIGVSEIFWEHISIAYIK